MEMTKQEIINEIYRDDIYDQIIDKFCYEEYRDDLKQELFLILLEKDDEIIKKAYHNNTIKYYIIRIIINQTKSSSSPFFRKYKMLKFEDIELENIEIEEDNIKPHFDIIRYANENKLLSWYENEIFNIYYQLDDKERNDERKTLRDIQEEYGIKFNSIYWTLTKVRNKIKKHIKENNVDIWYYSK